eukprot:g8108.t1
MSQAVLAAAVWTWSTTALAAGRGSTTSSGHRRLDDQWPSLVVVNVGEEPPLPRVPVTFPLEEGRPGGLALVGGKKLLVTSDRGALWFVNLPETVAVRTNVDLDPATGKTNTTVEKLPTLTTADLDALRSVLPEDRDWAVRSDRTFLNGTHDGESFAWSGVAADHGSWVPWDELQMPSNVTQFKVEFPQPGTGGGVLGSLGSVFSTSATGSSTSGGTSGSAFLQGESGGGPAVAPGVFVPEVGTQRRLAATPTGLKALLLTVNKEDGNGNLSFAFDRGVSRPHPSLLGDYRDHSGDKVWLASKLGAKILYYDTRQKAVLLRASLDETAGGWDADGLDALSLGARHRSSFVNVVRKVVSSGKISADRSGGGTTRTVEDEEDGATAVDLPFTSDKFLTSYEDSEPEPREETQSRRREWGLPEPFWGGQWAKKEGEVEGNRMKRKYALGTDFLVKGAPSLGGQTVSTSGSGAPTTRKLQLRVLSQNSPNGNGAGEELTAFEKQRMSGTGFDPVAVFPLPLENIVGVAATRRDSSAFTVYAVRGNENKLYAFDVNLAHTQQVDCPTLV